MEQHMKTIDSPSGNLDGLSNSDVLIYVETVLSVVKL